MHEIPIRSFQVSCFLLRRLETTTEVLLLKRAQKAILGGVWCQVAGSIEHGETAVDAVFREVEEETGLRPSEIYSTMECEQYYRLDLNCISVLPVFVAFVGCEEDVRINYEHSEHGWFDINEARELLPLPIQRKLLSRVEEEFIKRDPSPAAKVSRSGA